MADTVSRLKELLFQQEAATLADLQLRIEEVANQERQARAAIAAAATEAEARIAASLGQVDQASKVRIEELGRIADGTRALQLQLDERLAALARRTGTPEALKSSVAEVLDEVIDEARENRQEDLTRSLAPILVKTIKAELRNNQDEMVQALYPITGQLVKAYVASAMKDLTARMNRRLSSNPVMLRLRSLFSGYSMAELALAESQQLEVEELYLIRRGSGELIQRWPASPIRSNSDMHMTNVLAAINDYATTAFQTEGGQLRSLDIDDYTVFLRASPVYLLAAKCRGTAAPGVESLIDQEFLRAVSEHQASERETGGDAPPHLLTDLQSRVEGAISARHEVLARAGLPFSPLRAAIATAVLAICAGLGWYGWTTWEVETTRAKARTAIASVPALDGFPVMLEVGPRGQSVSVAGLAPSEIARTELMARFGADLPGVKVDPKGFAVLPGSPPDLTPDLAQVRRNLGGVEALVKAEIAATQQRTAHEAAQRSLARTERRLDQAASDLGVLARLQDGARQPVIATALAATQTALGRSRTDLERLSRGQVSGSDQVALAGQLSARANEIGTAAGRLSGALGGTSQAAAASRADGERLGLAEAANEVALAAERLATVAAAAVQTAALPRPAPPTARQRLADLVRTQAVFFANNDDYRETQATARLLDTVAGLVKEAKATIRVVGYTDERGVQTRNSQLAQSRADKVAQDLVDRGVMRRQLIAVGRAAGPDISPTTGPDSSNRRVEFEIAFEGEGPLP